MRALALSCWLVGLGTAALGGPGVIQSAEYFEPTERYQHGVFGETSEWGGLRIWVSDACAGCANANRRHVQMRLPETHVFEDIAPRVVDLNGDGHPEVVVVETNINQGARLAIYDETGLITATPYIGRAHRWLAPAGFGDFNNDGQIDLAYVETPHLGRVLRMFTLQGTASPQLVEIGRVEGFTNHRIGDPNIWGGVRACNGTAVLIGANSNWTRMLVGTISNGVAVITDIGLLESPAQLDAALDCSYPIAR